MARVNTFPPPGRFGCGTVASCQLIEVPFGRLKLIRSEAGCSSSIRTGDVRPGLTVSGALAGLTLFQETRLPGTCALYGPAGMKLKIAQPRSLVVPVSELVPESWIETPASGLPRRSVARIVAVPLVAENEAGGVISVLSVTGWSALAGAVAVEVTLRYCAWSVSSLQLSSPVLSRIQTVFESTA